MTLFIYFMRSKKHKLILIRADGSKTIGMGHLNRASLIATNFSAKGYKTKIVMKDDINGKRYLSNREVSLQSIPQSISIKDELKVIYNLIISESSCIFILDVLYHEKYQAMISNLAKEDCLSFVITDESEKTTIEADIVLNGNPRQLDYDHTDSPGIYLMGPKYFIMDSSYKQIKVEPPKEKIKTLLLSVGGADQHGLLFSILNALEKLNTGINIKVISSEASGYIDKLKPYLNDLSISTELYIDVESLAPFWSACDLAITAGGNTLFERIATRLPGATVCQLERQMEIANAFEDLGVNYNVGYGPELSDKILFERMESFLDNTELHRTQYLNAPRVTDGLGLTLFGKEIELLLKRGSQ